VRSNLEPPWRRRRKKKIKVRESPNDTCFSTGVRVRFLSPTTRLTSSFGLVFSFSFRRLFPPRDCRPSARESPPSLRSRAVTSFVFSIAHPPFPHIPSERLHQTTACHGSPPRSVATGRGHSRRHQRARNVHHERSQPD
jgi:hypothetical protein